MSESRNLRKTILRVARNILECPTAPHHEDLVAKAIRAELDRVASIRTDAFGNMIATIGRPGKTPLAFCAHMDHPGFGIKKARGKLIEAEFGGWVQKPYFKAGVRVDLFDEHGVRTGTARIVKVLDWPGKRILLKLATGRAEAGQFGMWALPAMKIQKGLLHSRACDDLIGCAAIVTTLLELARRKKSGVGIFTRREELGLCGAFDLARSKRIPKSWNIISIETSSIRVNALQKDGPIVRVGDRSSIFCPDLTAHLCRVASSLEKKSFRWQRKLMDGGTCEATAFCREGYPSSGLCIALGNYHNSGKRDRIAAENVDVEDLTGLVRLMIETAATR